MYKPVCKYTYIIKIIFPSWPTIFLPKVKDQLRKTLTPGMRSPLLSYWSWLSKRLPKHYRPLLLPWLPPELEGKSPLLQTQAPGICDLELTRKLLPWGLTFMVLDMQASEGNNPVLPSYDSDEPQQWPEWHDNPKGTVVTCIPIFL